MVALPFKRVTNGPLNTLLRNFTGYAQVFTIILHTTTVSLTGVCIDWVGCSTNHIASDAR